MEEECQLIADVAERLGFLHPLKDAQIECLLNILRKKDTVAILPTGYGKSIIYQLAPHVLKAKFHLQKSVCLVLTPLNSIMIDQINSLHTLGITACWLDYTGSAAQTLTNADVEDQDSDEGDENGPDSDTVLMNVPIQETLTGNYSLIYAHPEAVLRSKHGEALLQKFEAQQILSCIAVDEAHMILEWGSEFRKDFGKIGEQLLARFPELPVLVFTATASPRAQAEITASLKLKNARIISQNPDRKNIKYSKILRPPPSSTQEHLEEILSPIVDELLEKKQEYPVTIMYTDTIVISYAYSFFEKKMGRNQYVGEEIPENRLFAQYHQNYTDRMKKYIVTELCKDTSRIRIVFATVALGMGLNAPHIRCVIHYKPPTSIEKYFQETGRAGRDGLPSRAILYYNGTDIRRNRPGIEKSIIEYCKNDSRCRRAVMLEYFGYTPSETTECCDICDEKLVAQP